jgi:glycosyltransferase involved in cell wall biosynthesis
MQPINMKKVLIIAYYFPPSGGPGVQRVLKHVQYLRDFGWQPYVLTVSNGQFPARDESLLEKIPKDVKVFRTHIYEPYDLYRFFTGKKKGTAIDVNVIKKEGQKFSWKEKIAEWIRATFFIPDARVGWLFTAEKKAKQIIAEEGIDAIYSSSPPYTCSIIARNLKRVTGLPWVAGFRDPWTGFISSPKRWFLPARIDKGMEHSVFKESDLVEAAWLGIIKDATQKFPDLETKKFIHVPNGYDSNDFPEYEQKSNDCFTLTYTGSMYGRRNPDSLFKALNLLLENKKINPEKIKLKFIGRFGVEVEEMFRNSGIENSLEIYGYMSHSESVKHLLESDALLLVVDESKESEEIVPGKVYEYIGVKRPILAIAPNQSAIAELLRDTGSGKVAHQSEIEKIANNFLDYFNKWEKNESIFSPDIEKVNSFERKNAAKTLSELLNKIS